MTMRRSSTATILALAFGCNASATEASDSWNVGDSAGSAPPASSQDASADATALPAPRFTSFIFEPVKIPVASLCPDHFERVNNSGYATGASGQSKNVDNRLEWARPLMEAKLFASLQVATNMDDGGLMNMEKPQRYYPIFAYDRRNDAPDGSPDQFPLYFPKDSDTDRITPQMRAADPARYPEWATFVDQPPPENVVLLTTCWEKPLVDSASTTR